VVAVLAEQARRGRDYLALRLFGADLLSRLDFGHVD
jgi:hypothetical protein